MSFLRLWTNFIFATGVCNCATVAWMLKMWRKSFFLGRIVQMPWQLFGFFPYLLLPLIKTFVIFPFLHFFGWIFDETWLFKFSPLFQLLYSALFLDHTQAKYILIRFPPCLVFQTPVCSQTKQNGIIHGSMKKSKIWSLSCHESWGWMDWQTGGWVAGVQVAAIIIDQTRRQQGGGASAWPACQT